MKKTIIRQIINYNYMLQKTKTLVAALTALASVSNG